MKITILTIIFLWTSICFSQNSICNLLSDFLQSEQVVNHYPRDIIPVWEVNNFSSDMSLCEDLEIMPLNESTRRYNYYFKIPKYAFFSSFSQILMMNVRYFDMLEGRSVDFRVIAKNNELFYVDKMDKNKTSDNHSWQKEFFNSKEARSSKSRRLLNNIFAHYADIRGESLFELVNREEDNIEPFFEITDAVSLDGITLMKIKYGRSVYYEIIVVDGKLIDLQMIFYK